MIVQATEFVARIMASADLVSSFPSLHKDFVARYNDQNYEVRISVSVEYLDRILELSEDAEN